MFYSIKEFAKLFNTSEHTIRYYTDINFLPCKRDSNNRRIFDEESLNWMQGITCLKGCGASIKTIIEYCDLCKLPESEENLKARYNIILKQRDEIHKKIEEMKFTSQYINNKVKHYENILSGTILDDTNPKNWTDKSRPYMH
ncbi:MAG: MerR family transcriptional regulator [Lachnospirales bacterium]